MDNKILRVGDKLHGYCGGYFNGSHSDKRVEAIGSNWVVAREIDSGQVEFEGGINPEELLQYTKETEKE